VERERERVNVLLNECHDNLSAVLPPLLLMLMLFNRPGHQYSLQYIMHALTTHPSNPTQPKHEAELDGIAVNEQKLCPPIPLAPRDRVPCRTPYASLSRLIRK